MQVPSIFFAYVIHIRCALRERLEEAFKIKRERWRNFNKCAKEFHKKKERIHREKIDRIQREKINLLKINDVEGYLRMVQVCLHLNSDNSIDACLGYQVLPYVVSIPFSQ